MKFFSRIVTVFSCEKRISRITLKNFIIKYELSLKCKFESETLGSYFFASGHCVGSESSDIVHLPEILLKV